MTAAAARKPAVAPNPVDAFVARCEAAARRWQAGYRSLHDTVDSLQCEAEASGLVDSIGQGEVQAIIAKAFASCASSGASSDRGLEEFQVAASGAVLEALAYQLRTGFTALSEPSARRRLFELNKFQVLDIANRLTRPFRVPPWSESEIKALIKMWSKRNGVRS